MAKKKTARSTQRHRALDVVFEADEKNLLAYSDLMTLLKERQKVSTAQVPIGEFGSKIVELFAENADDIDTMLEAASEDWALNRMNVVDRTVLRLGAAEFMYLDTPRALLISEWANLAREFSTERSVGFVMGVLNRVADIKQSERGETVLSKLEREAAEGMAAGEAETLAAMNVNSEGSED